MSNDPEATTEAHGWQREMSVDEKILSHLDNLAAQIAETNGQILATLQEFLKAWRAYNPPRKAVRAVLILNNIKGADMPTGQITVDTTPGAENATLGFVDDKGDTNAPAPVAASGAALVATFSPSDDTVLTVANDGTNPLQGDVTPVAEGTGVTISVALSFADGSPVLDEKGNPFPAVPPSQPITVGPGEAAGAALVLSI